MEFQDLRLAVLKTGVLSFDLETTSLDTKTAEIVLIAMSSGKGNGIKRVAVTPTPEAVAFLVEHLENPKMRVVGHNVISYDLEVLHHRGIIKMGDVKAKIIDTLLLSWLYNENMPHGLKPCVKRFFKYEMTTYAEAFLNSPSLLQIDESRKQIEEIQKKEIDRVGTVFRKQRSAAKKKLELEFKEKFKGRRTNKDNEEKKVDRAKIVHYLEKEYGPDSMDYEKDRLHLEKIVPILDNISKLEVSAEQEQREYAKDDAKQSLRLYYFLRRRILNMGLADWAEMMMAVRRISAVMEMNGIMIDVDTLKEYETAFALIAQEFQARAWDTARGELNLSSPKQIKELLYQKLAIEPVPGDVYPNMHEKAGEWRYSTDEATLSRMPHKIGQQILDYRAIQKLHSTYIKTLYEKASSNPERRLYGRFNTTGTVTGRWSSSGPNLQNIPSRSKAAHFDDRIKDLGPKIRRLFIAPPGKKLICSDLSQIELRLITHLTQDLNLLSVYTESAEWDGITYYTGDIHYKTATTLDIVRKLAKNLNFGLCLIGGTPVLTDKGYRPIEEIEVGTSVMTRNGWSRVTDTQSLHSTDLVEIETTSGKTLVGTPDHMLEKYFPAANGKKGGKGWVEMSRLTEGDYLVYHGQGHRSGRRVPKDSCRLLGWFLSEGSYSNHRYKISQDPRVNPKVTKKMDATLGFAWYDLKGSPHISAPKKVFENHLRKFDMQDPRMKRIPSSVFGLNESCRLEIIGTLWDGDGSVVVSRRRGEITYASKDRPLLQDVVRLLNSVGINSRIYDYDPNLVASVGVIGQKSKLKFLDKVPTVKTEGVVYEPKKRFDAEEKIIRVTRRRSQKPVPVYDLTVEKDHSFIANGLVSHNCYGMFPKKFARYARLFIEDEEGNKVYDVPKATTYRNGFFMLYPGIQDMMEALEEMREMKDGKFPQVKFQTICGRYRHFPIEDRVTGGKILNSIIQGSASDILNVVVWAIDKFILQNPRYKDVKMILQVHDEVCLEAPEELANEVGILVKYIMECDWFPMSVPVLASTKICDKWSDNGNDDIPEVGVLPPESSGIRAAVAMLTPEDRKWASQFVTVKDFTPDTDEARFVAV